MPRSQQTSRPVVPTTSAAPPPPRANHGTDASVRRWAAPSGDTSAMQSRLTSSHFVGRVGELAELQLAVREAQAGRPALVLLGGDSGVGKTRLVAELEHRLSREVDGEPQLLVLRGDGVEQADGELPYAPLLSALRPLIREHHPAFDALTPGSRAQLATILPGLDDGRPPARRRSRPDRTAAPVRGPARADRRAQRVHRRAPDPRGPALGRPLDPDVRGLPGSQPASGAGRAAAHLPRRRALPPPSPAPAALRARAARSRAADRTGAV